MIRSCKACKTNCCKFGPGPYTILSVKTFLKIYCTPTGYNTQCEGLMKNGGCEYWGTKNLPFECRTWICNVRSYTLIELKKIQKLLEG